MYNYFMIIGYVETFNGKTLSVKVIREFGSDFDIIPINIDWYKYAEDLKLGKGDKVSIKGRVLAKANGELELIAERIMTM